MVTVTQSDRDAAVGFYSSNGQRRMAGGILRGFFDSNPLVQAFARHREEACRQLEADKAELVALMDEAFELLGGVDGACELRSKMLRAFKTHGGSQ